MRKIISLSTTPSNGDIVLDFFAGSASTAHALIEQNLSDSGNRTHITVQLPEVLDTENKAQEIAAAVCDELGVLRTVSELAKERLRRAAEKISQKIQGRLDLERIDLGFKVFKLNRSNFAIWDGDVDKVDDLAKQLGLHVDHIDQASGPEDILYELLLKAGFELTTKVEKQTMAGKDVYAVADGALLICLDKEITPQLIDALADANPLQVICLDEGFKGNDQLKTNAVQTFKSRAKEDGEATVFRTV